MTLTSWQAELISQLLRLRPSAFSLNRPVNLWNELSIHGLIVFQPAPSMNSRAAVSSRRLLYTLLQCGMDVNVDTLVVGMQIDTARPFIMDRTITLIKFVRHLCFPI
jgi:hypothetical protein